MLSIIQVVFGFLFVVSALVLIFLVILEPYFKEAEYQRLVQQRRERLREMDAEAIMNAARIFRAQWDMMLRNAKDRTARAPGDWHKHGF